MKSLVIFESQFGNTREIAHAIALGLAEASEVSVRDVGEAPAGGIDGIDLLVLGGPTHAFSMSRPESRRASESDGGAGTAIGLRDWIAALPRPVPVARVVTFCTRQGHSPFSGSAAKSAAKAVRRRGAVASASVGFVVTGKTGPLEEGELERATAWGRALVS